MQHSVSRGFIAGSVSSVRRGAFYVCAAALTLIVCADFISHALEFGPPHRVHEITHEIVSGAIIVCAISQLVAPRRFVAAAQQLLVLFALGWLFDALSLRFSGIGVILLLGVAIAALHPARDEVLSFRGRFHLSLAIIALLGAIPLTIYALQELAYQRLDVAPIHASLGHWEWAATMAAALFILGLLAALGTPGFRLPAWTAGLGAVCFGAASLLYPGEASSVSLPWAIVAIAGGAIFIGVAEWLARRAGQ